MRGVEDYLNDLNTAVSMLSPYVGQPIIYHGNPVTDPRGVAQTYFSATTEQRNDFYLNTLGERPNSIVLGMDRRDANRLGQFSVLNGSTERFTLIEETIIGSKALEAVFSKLFAIGVKGGAGEFSYVLEPPFNPSGSIGAAQAWSMKGRLNYVELPTSGKIRYVPPESYVPSQPLPRGPNNGYIDKFGNEWTKGPSRTAGQSFEWDVQLSNTGRSQLGWASRDGSHLNVSLDGRITHK
ncbi:hypothetical protein AGMMS49545_24150 [Betaproteobacteria bacterium]|nr:hypothetical protein AGMMS49545_24150 [Betaproteobacteria bacterium]